MSPRIMACLESLSWIRVTSKNVGVTLAFGGFGPEGDGVYCLVDATLLGWMDYMLRMLSLKASTNHDDWSRSVLFYHELLAITGLTPTQGFPAGYGDRPEIEFPEGWEK